MQGSSFYRFRLGKLEAISEAQAESQKLLVADSWLVEDGRVRSLQRHFDRFSGWVRASSKIPEDELETFLGAAKELLPESGRWFPRIELAEPISGGLELRFRTRPAAEPWTRAILWVDTAPDSRANPWVKGPDLSHCMQLRRKAQLHGASEAVLVNQSNEVLEGALSSIIWWEKDVLCLPEADLPWLPSITRDELLQIAKSLGTEIKFTRATVAEVAQRETWILSSLQGFCPVEQWLGFEPVPIRQDRLSNFQRRLRLFEHSELSR